MTLSAMAQPPSVVMLFAFPIILMFQALSRQWRSLIHRDDTLRQSGVE